LGELLFHAIADVARIGASCALAEGTLAWSASPSEGPDGRTRGACRHGDLAWGWCRKTAGGDQNYAAERCWRTIVARGGSSSLLQCML